MATTKIYGSVSVLISSESPDRNFAVDEIFGDDESAKYSLIQAFDQNATASLRFRKITGWMLYYHLARESPLDMSLGELGIIAANYEIDAVTYNSRPRALYVKRELVPSYYHEGYYVPIYSSADISSVTTSGMSAAKARVMLALLTLACGIHLDNGF